MMPTRLPPPRRLRFSREQLAHRRKGFQPVKPRAAEPSMGMAEALVTLREAPAAVRQIIEQHRAAIAEQVRQVNADRNLTEQGRLNRLAELRAQANEPAAQASKQLRAEVEQARASLAARAERARPKPAAGLESLMARQIAWSRVREMLQSDVVPLDEVIAEADAETLHAMASELPSFLRVGGLNADRRADVLRAVDDQLAHVAGGRVLEAHEALRESEVHLARVEPLLDHTDAVGAGRARAGGSLTAALASSVAADEAAARLDPPAEEESRARLDGSGGLTAAFASSLAPTGDAGDGAADDAA